MNMRMKKKLFVVSSGVFLLIALFGLGWMLVAFRATAAPITASESFLHAFLANDTEKAYAMTAESFRTSTDRDTFNQTAEKVSGILDRKSLKITTGNVEDSDDGSKIATFYYDVKAEAQPYRLTIKMIKPLDTQTWQVLSVDNQTNEEAAVSN
jgi:hypothetical protein